MHSSGGMLWMLRIGHMLIGTYRLTMHSCVGCFLNITDPACVEMLLGTLAAQKDNKWKTARIFLVELMLNNLHIDFWK